jgi:aspartate-semialdehyde dehydrogenase
VTVSTYQSASGAGRGGVTELFESLRAWAKHIDNQEASGEASSVEDAHADFEAPEGDVFDHPLAFEALPHIGSFDETGFTSEERKMVHETRKIMDLPELSVGAHCVRVPVVRSHSESMTLDFDQPVDTDAIREAWRSADGVRLHDAPQQADYPLAKLAEGDDDTWVGRLRADLERPETVHFWCVSDNLRKGAALNSLQILEHLLDR